ncbi:hypothetical protein KGQ20_21620 [Catenulispora sp. NF23]|uniref:Uncharacterized protein n=1 Tax=Catenulispora pinistramenti TaxID=2705254 RepID=A0ABS5KQK6_9ACTN|nr:hypothetical protein [Catenulispora pinistramenti]MBS2535368.1 hypothetical protein [Catenulispora pinistramenti]MBS2548338.1 hypothetical protein [Catenulispora pinistramenti]
MSAWTPRPDTVVHNLARGCDSVLLGRAADGTWRLAGAGLGDERWNNERLADLDEADSIEVRDAMAILIRTAVVTLRWPHQGSK